MAHIISFPASAQPLGLVDRVKKLFADLRLYQATVRELVRIAVDAGFTPAIRNSRFEIIEWPDVEAILHRAPSNPEAERAVGASA